MSKKLTKFCRLTKFVEQNNKALYQAFDDLCLFGLFSIRGKGVTFLLPTDKGFIKKIIDATYSSKPEDAVAMIKTLVLLDFLPSIDSFNKADVIANALYQKLDIEEVNVAKKYVKLKSGHKLELNSKFIPMRSNDPVAVYTLSGKDILPLKTTKVDLRNGPDGNDRGHNGKSRNGDIQDTAGGRRYGGVSGGHDDYDKSVLARYIEKKHSNNMKTDKKSCAFKSFMAYFYKLVHDSNDDELIKRVYSGMCAFARASFYVLVSPYSDEDYYDIECIMHGVLKFKDLKFDTWDTCESVYIRARDKLIEKARKLTEFSVSDNNKYVTEERKKVKENRSKMDTFTLLQNIYRNDDRRLAKDIFTSFCYLSICEKEVEEPTWFDKCFIPIVRNTYDKITNILNHNRRDIAYAITAYHALLCSDIFLYLPYNNSDQRDGDYKVGYPQPTNYDLYSAEENEQVKIHGGGCCGIEGYMNE